MGVLSGAARVDSSPLTARAVGALEAVALAAAALLAALDSGDALSPGARALFDRRFSNIGDPWPTIVAAGKLAASFHAPIYDDFDRVGSSFIYPPISALPFTPFASLDYEGAHLALSIVSRLAWVVCVALALSLAWDRQRPVSFAAFAVATLGFYPLLRAVELNQATLLVTAAIGVSLVCATRGRDAAAGVAFAAAAAFKPQLVLVLLLVGWRSRRFAVAGLTAIAILGCASLAYGGIHNHVAYVTTVLPALSDGYAFYPNQSWSGTFQRLAGVPSADFAITVPPTGVRIAASIASGCTLLAGALAIRRAASTPSSSPRRDLRGEVVDAPRETALFIGFAWVIVTLASPISWEHHYAPAIFVFAMLFRRARTLPTAAVALACAAFPLVAGFIDVRSFHGALGRLAMSYVMFGGWMLAGALWCALRADRDEPAAPVPPRESAFPLS